MDGVAAAPLLLIRLSLRATIDVLPLSLTSKHPSSHSSAAIFHLSFYVQESESPHFFSNLPRNIGAACFGTQTSPISSISHSPTIPPSTPRTSSSLAPPTSAAPLPLLPPIIFLPPLRPILSPKQCNKLPPTLVSVDDLGLINHHHHHHRRRRYGSNPFLGEREKLAEGQRGDYIFDTYEEVKNGDDCPIRLSTQTPLPTCLSCLLTLNPIPGLLAGNLHRPGPSDGLRPRTLGCHERRRNTGHFEFQCLGLEVPSGVMREGGHTGQFGLSCVSRANLPWDKSPYPQP
jgi:hypothetical protein